MARRHYSKLNSNSTEYSHKIYTVSKGGTSSRTPTAASSSLGSIEKGTSSKVVLLEQGVDGKAKIPTAKLPSSISSLVHVKPSLSNYDYPRVSPLGSCELTITDYDFQMTYIPEVIGAGQVSIDEDKITYTAPATKSEGGDGFILNDKRYPIEIVEDSATVETPVIMAPVDKSDNVSLTYTFIASPFVTDNLSNTHVSSDWQISKDIDFQTIFLSSYDDTANKITWTGLMDHERLQYYIRVRYKGSLSGTTNWSNAVAFTTRLENNYTEVQSLVPQEPTDYVFYGTSLAVSDDGSVVVVGSPGSNGEYSSQIGSVDVYRKSNSEWSLESTLQDPSITDVYASRFGSTVCISGAGTSVLVGIPDYDNGKGSALLYNKVSGEWIPTNRFLPNDLPPLAHFGDRIAINATGDVVAIACKNCVINDLLNAGRVYVYRKPSAQWVLSATLQVDVPLEDDYFGFNIAINGTGDRLAITSLKAHNNYSGVHIVDYANDTWSITDTLYLPPMTNSPIFGRELVFNDAGNTLIISYDLYSTYVTIDYIGARYVNGGLYTYQNVDGEWISRYLLTPPDEGTMSELANDSIIQPEDTMSDNYGLSCCINNTGTKILVTASEIVRYGDYNGVAYIDLLNTNAIPTNTHGGNIRQITRDIPIKTGLGGFPVSAMSRDSSTIVIGAPGDHYNGLPYCGVVYIFQQ